MDNSSTDTGGVGRDVSLPFACCQKFSSQMDGQGHNIVEYSSQCLKFTIFISVLDHLQCMVGVYPIAFYFRDLLLLTIYQLHVSFDIHLSKCFVTKHGMCSLFTDHNQGWPVDTIASYYSQPLGVLHE